MSSNWLSNLPDDWEVIALKRVTELKNVRVIGNSSSENYIGLEHIESWTGRLINSEPAGNTSPDEENQRGTAGSFDRGDILFGKLRPYLAKAYLAQSSGICTTELLVLKPVRADGRYLLHVILTNEFIEQVNSTTFGARMPRADWNDIGNIPIPIPPLPEQRAIADYLHRETARLDTLIATKEHLLELLVEKRISIINEFITRGNAENTIQKDKSPAPWLFPLPTGWKRQPLKHISFTKGRIGYEELRAEEYTEEGPYLVSSAHFNNGKVEWERCNHVTRERFEMAPDIILRKDDVLFMKDGAAMGKLAYIDELPGEACLNSHILLIRPLQENYLPKFLFYVLMTDVFKAYMEQERKGTTFFGFSEQSMGNFPMSFPSVSEQKTIVAALEERLAKIDRLTLLANQTIDYLKERRVSLIAAAVSGQIRLM